MGRTGVVRRSPRHLDRPVSENLPFWSRCSPAGRCVPGRSSWGGRPEGSLGPRALRGGSNAGDRWEVLSQILIGDIPSSAGPTSLVQGNRLRYAGVFGCGSFSSAIEKGPWASASSMARPTACPTNWSENRSRSATPPQPSRSSSRAGAWRPTLDATTAERPPWPSTCRALIAPRRVDALEAHRMGREGRTRDRPARHPHPREPPPPRAGIPDRAGHHALGAAARRRPARRRQRPRAGHPLVPLPHRQEHPRRRPGPPALEPPAETIPTPNHTNICNADILVMPRGLPIAVTA